MMVLLTRSLLIWSVLTSCAGHPDSSDAGAGHDAAARDAGGIDAGRRDAGRADAGRADAALDASRADGGPDAAGLPDAGPCEATSPTPQVAVGALRRGATLRVSGCGFGLKERPEPLMWDDFDDGTDGEPLARWGLHSNDDRPPTYSAEETYGGSRMAGRADYTDGQAGSAAAIQEDEGWTTLYLSFQLRLEHLSGDSAGGNWKLARFAAGVPDLFHGDPKMGPTWNCNGWPWHYNAGPNDRDTYWAYGGDTLPTGTWHRLEMGARLSSTPGASDGIAFAGFDSSFARYDRDAVTLSEENDYPAFRTVALSHYLSHECRCSPAICSGDHYVYYDDVYVDTTFARVEVCDAPRWEDRTRCEMQIPAEWSDGSLTLDANPGAFPPGETVYLYVHDREDQANERGLELRVEEGL